MISGVYIGKSNIPDYGLVSTGDYINPIAPVFRLKDSGTTIEKVIPLYFIIHDIDVEFIKLKVTGHMTTIRAKLSLDNKNWLDEIVINEEIDARGTTITKPFYLKFYVDDVLMYYNLQTMSTIRNFKLQLLYT